MVVVSVFSAVMLTSHPCSGFGSPSQPPSTPAGPARGQALSSAPSGWVIAGYRWVRSLVIAGLYPWLSLVIAGLWLGQ